MKALRILYVGALNGTCLDRANAYRRLGHAVYHIDARAMLPSSIWVDRATWRLGGEIFAPWVRQGLTYAVSSRKFDLCHVDNGEWASPSVVQRLRDYASLVINYNIDDPFGKRDHQRFSAYRKALKHYDLVAVDRKSVV